MLEISINQKTFFLPERWEEVPAWKYLPVLKCVFGVSEKLNLLRISLGISERNWKALIRKYTNSKLSKEELSQNYAVLQDMLDQIKWMWQDDLIVRPFDFIEVQSRNLLLFADGFEGMTYSELTNAWVYAQMFLEGNEDKLDYLCATVCRLKNTRKGSSWQGDQRVDFSEFIVKEQSESWFDVSMSSKIIIFVYFMSCLKRFLSNFDISDSDHIGPPKAEDYPGQSLKKNEFSLNEKKVFGNTNAKDTPVHEVYLFLHESKLDYLEAKKRQKTNDNE